MNEHGKKRLTDGLPVQAGDYCVLLIDALLLGALALQVIIAGCLLTYGNIPVPAGWAASWFERTGLEGVRLEVDEVRLGLGGSVRVTRPRLFLEEQSQPFLETDIAVFQLNFPGKDGGLAPGLASLVVAGGTAYLPAFYSPSGQRLSVLEKTAFKLEIGDDRIRIESFAALHQAMRVRGALEWPIPAKTTPRKESPRESLNRIFHLLAEGVREADRLAPLEAPTLFFNLSENPDKTLDGQISLSSRKLRHDRVEGENIRLRTGLSIVDGKPVPQAPILATALKLSVPEYGIEIDSLSANIAAEDLGRMFEKEPFEIELAANSLTRGELSLKAPVLTIDPGDLKPLRFSGSAEGLKGAFAYAGEVDPEARSARISASGMLDLRDLIPEKAAARLPEINWIEPPYARLDARFASSFALKSADFSIQLGSTTAAGVRFDSVHARGHYDSGTGLALDSVQLTRGRQWLESRFNFDTATRDYSLTLLGSAIPYEYNALLPRWWATIFKDIRFDGPNSAYGDFIIHGKAGSHSVRLFYGSADGGGIRYHDVPIERGHLKVRGRERYVELFDLDAASDGGSLKGHFSWTSRPDEVHAPLSTRYALESRLSLDALGKLVPESIASIIGQFSPAQLPSVQLEGAYFHPEYPEFTHLSSFKLSADANGAVTVRGIPLERLAFKLDGRERKTHLRDLRFGYAGGNGTGEADILPREGAAATVRFKAELTGADRHKATDGIAQLDGEEPSPKTESAAPHKPSQLDLDLHAEGPADDFYGYHGFGRFDVEDPELGALQLLGPLSRILQNTPLGFTTFSLRTANGRFELSGDHLSFPELRIDGERTRITAKGTARIPDKALDMRVLVQLFGNVGDPEGAFRQLGRVLNPLSNFLTFHLTGTTKDPQWRSLYDPRNFIPGL